jgi:hypothetical protein
MEHTPFQRDSLRIQLVALEPVPLAQKQGESVGQIAWEQHLFVQPAEADFARQDKVALLGTIETDPGRFRGAEHTFLRRVEQLELMANKRDALLGQQINSLPGRIGRGGGCGLLYRVGCLSLAGDLGSQPFESLKPSILGKLGRLEQPKRTGRRSACSGDDSQANDRNKSVQVHNSLS